MLSFDIFIQEHQIVFMLWSAFFLLAQTCKYADVSQ